ncbi:MAG: hypothetical protein K0S81_1442 [Rhodospirillales bacterium]|nr:hypothetical protein [Rhodospirillales bacterium]
MALRKGGGARGRRPLRILLGFVAIVLLSVPLSVPATLLLLPFWSWLESAAGIEAVGHSGPAEWSYLLVFAVLVSGAAILYLLRGKAEMLRDS